MEKLSKIKNIHFIQHILFFILLISPILAVAESPAPSKKSPIEGEVLKALSQSIQCKKIEVQIESLKEKPNALKTLMVKFDGINSGQMAMDYITIIYEDPVIDLIKLKQSKELNISSYSKNKVSILISIDGIEKYFSNKAKEFKKRYDQISIKFSPPYIECFFDVPAKEISPETLQLISKFVKGGRLEGYAAFQIKAKDNMLYALSSKVIINHFLVPDLILREFQTKFNPFDSIPILKPFQYSINTVTVQNKYIYMSN